jgi:hypothetical protein
MTMMGLAEPPDRWDATNSNAARALTLAAAGFEAVSKLVKAESLKRSRLGTVISSKNGWILPELQEGKSRLALRLQNWRA